MPIKRRIFNSRNFRNNNGTANATQSITKKDNMSTDLKKANMSSLSSTTTSQQSYNSVKGAALVTLTTLVVGASVGAGIIAYNDAHKDETPPTNAISTTFNDVDYYFVNTNNSEDFICLKSFSGIDEEDTTPDGQTEEDFTKVTYDLADHSESTIIKTKTNHYVVIDVGTNNPNAIGNLFHQLQLLQNTDTPTIDYLIISHHHSDHMAGITSLANDPYKGKLTIKTFVDKYTAEESKLFSKVQQIDPNVKLKLIDKDDILFIDENLSLYFFNANNVWRNANCKQNYTTLTFSAAANKKDEIESSTFKVDGDDTKEVFLYINRQELCISL